MIIRSNGLMLALLTTALVVGGAAPGDALTVALKRFGAVGAFFGARDTTTGQFVRVNVGNLVGPGERRNPCDSEVTFFDATGAVRKQARFSVANGQIGFVDATRGDFGDPNERVQLRATVRVATAIGDPNTRCKATLEAVDVRRAGPLSSSRTGTYEPDGPPS